MMLADAWARHISTPVDAAGRGKLRPAVEESLPKKNTSPIYNTEANDAVVRSPLVGGALFFWLFFSFKRSHQGIM